MVGGFFATNIGSTMPFGMEGWRFAFHLMAAVSLVTSALVFYMATDPRPTAKVHVPAAYPQGQASCLAALCAASAMSEHDNEHLDCQPPPPPPPPPRLFSSNISDPRTTPACAQMGHMHTFLCLPHMKLSCCV